MRILLLLGLFPGCIWSRHLHEYAVDIDSPASLEVSVLTADGVQPMLASGTPEDRATIVVDGIPLSVIRDAGGVRVEAPKGLGPMHLVDAYGKAPGTFGHGEARVKRGKPLLIERRFAFGQMEGLIYSEDGYVIVQAAAPWSSVERIEARQHPSRAAGLAMWAVELALLVPALKLAGDEKYVPAAALIIPAGVLGWWGVGQLFGPRRDITVHSGE